jgi:hypothetical protein
MLGVKRGQRIKPSVAARRFGIVMVDFHSTFFIRTRTEQI